MLPSLQVERWARLRDCHTVKSSHRQGCLPPVRLTQVWHQIVSRSRSVGIRTSNLLMRSPSSDRSGTNAHVIGIFQGKNVLAPYPPETLAIVDRRADHPSTMLGLGAGGGGFAVEFDGIP
jgi:hypothetical protein